MHRKEQVIRHYMTGSKNRLTHTKHTKEDGLRENHISTTASSTHKEELTIVMWFPLSRIWSSCVILLPSGVDSYSVTSSSTMFTKSSKPRSVPTISLSLFMMMWMREPMHLSTSSVCWAEGEVLVCANWGNT